MATTDTDLDALLDALIERAASRPPRPLVNVAGDEVGGRAATGLVVVNSGDTIMASWGNTTFNQTVVCFDTAAGRDAQWPAPHAGAACYTADAATFWGYSGGAWLPIAGPGAPPTTSGTLVSKTDLSGEVWVAKASVNGGAWKKARDVLHCTYSRSAAFNLTAAWSAIGYDAVISDPYGLYNLNNGVFTAPIAGAYLASMSMGASATATGQYVQVGLWAGGGPIIAGIGFASAAGFVSAVASGTRQVTAGGAITTEMLASGALVGRNNVDLTHCSFDYLGTG